VGRVLVHVVSGRDLTLEQLLHRVRVILQEGGAHDQLRGDELPVRPQVGLVDQHLAATFLHEARGPRLGHPRALDLPLLEGVERGGVVLRLDRHVAAAARVGVQTVLFQPRPQGHVLRIAELRRGQRLALQVGRPVDARSHHE
jgi:hypothetical protein